MSACEKCWKDAYRLDFSEPTVTHTDHYLQLLKERENNPCSEKEQKGDVEEKEEKIDHESFNKKNKAMEVFDSFIRELTI